MALLMKPGLYQMETGWGPQHRQMICAIISASKSAGSPRTMFDLRTHFYCSFDLSQDGSEHQEFQNAIDATKQWIITKLQRWADNSAFSGSWFESGGIKPLVLGNHILDVAKSDEAVTAERLWSLSYRHDDREWHYRKWLTEISIRFDGQTTTFTLRLSHFVLGDWMGTEPQLPKYTVPTLVALLIRSKTALSGNILLRDVPITVRSGQAELFKTFLESATRVLPVVLISKTSTNETLVRPKVLARALAPVAFVCEVEDQVSDSALADVLPYEFRTYGGAVRVYLPQVDTTQPRDAFRHRYFRFDEDDEGQSVESHITRAVLRRVAVQGKQKLIPVSEIRLRNTYSTAIAGKNTIAAVEALSLEINNLKKARDEQFAEYCSVQGRLESSEGELYDVRDELKDKTYQLEQLRGILKQRDTKEESASPVSTFRWKLSELKAPLPIVCVRSKQDPSFLESIADQIGVATDEISDLFTEAIDEHGSNQVTDLINSNRGKIVLYAHGHLKYVGPEDKKHFEEFFSAGKVRNAIIRFMQWVESSSQPRS